MQLHDLSAEGLHISISNHISIETGQETDFVASANKEAFRFRAKVVWRANLNNETHLGLEIQNNKRALVSLLAKYNGLSSTSDRRELRRLKKSLTIEGDFRAFNFPFGIPNLPSYKRSGKDRRQKSLANTISKPRSADRRHRAPDAGIRRRFAVQSIKSIFTVIRDLFVPLMPYPLVRLLIGTGDFCFIAHPRDFHDVSRMFPFARFLPERFVKFWFRFQKPFIASRINGKNRRNGKPLMGWILISPMWTEQMVRNSDLARKRIVQTVQFAEKLRAKIAGLGAFTSIVTHDGQDVLDHAKIGVTTGNSFSAAVAVANLIHALNLVGHDLDKAKISIVGAAGSVGSGCTKTLYGVVKSLHLVDINEPALKNLLAELPSDLAAPSVTTITTSSKIDLIKECDGVIVVTNAIGAIVNESHLKPGAVVIDCAQPKNVSKNIPLVRDDVLVIESAIVSSPDLNCQFDLDLGKGEALGCLAESIILSTVYDERNKTIIGKVDLDQVKDTYNTAVDLGFQLAYFRNSCGLVSELDIRRVRDYVAKTKT